MDRYYDIGERLAKVKRSAFRNRKKRRKPPRSISNLCPYPRADAQNSIEITTRFTSHDGSPSTTTRVVFSPRHQEEISEAPVNFIEIQQHSKKRYYQLTTAFSEWREGHADTGDSTPNRSAHCGGTHNQRGANLEACCRMDGKSNTRRRMRSRILLST